MIFLSKYKWLAIGLIWFASLCSASWVTYQVVTKQATQDKLEMAEKIIERKAQDDELKDSISKQLQESLAAIKPEITTINRKIEREVIQNTVYRDCKSTDGVVREYERKLDLQSK